MTKTTLKCQFLVSTPNGVVWMRGYSVVRTFGSSTLHELEHSPYCDRPHREVTCRPGDWSHSIGRDRFHNPTGDTSVPF